MSQPIIPGKTTNPVVKTKKAKPWHRTTVQIFFFIFVALITVNEALIKANLTSLPFLASASLHAICPFGGVVSIFDFVTAGKFVQKIHESSFILMGAAFLLTVGFGPLICGWVCPLGTVQEWISILGRKFFGKKFNHFIPEKADSYLRYLRYFILAFVLYATITSAKLVFQEYDPYFALFNFWSEEVALPALLILGVTIILSLFVERPWCKYACPYGAVLGVFNLFRIFKIRRNTSTCIDCKLCDKSCPMNIKVSTHQRVLDHQCISCLKCSSEEACPVANTVTLATRGEQGV